MLLAMSLTIAIVSGIAYSIEAWHINIKHHALNRVVIYRKSISALLANEVTS
jgi:hypothetical protein